MYYYTRVNIIKVTAWSLFSRGRQPHVAPELDSLQGDGLSVYGGGPPGGAEGWEEVGGGGLGGGDTLRVVQTLLAGGLHSVPGSIPSGSHPRAGPLVAEAD